jgi:hypothetical protein
MVTQATTLMLPVGTNNSYRQALSIPLDDFQLFSFAKLAWLRYVAFTIHGREGYISSTRRGTEIEADEQMEAKKYYYVSQGVSHHCSRIPLIFNNIIRAGFVAGSRSDG